MESAAKRKAGGGAAGESEGRPLKRQKVPVRLNPARWYGDAAPLALSKWTLDGSTRLSHCGMRDAGWGDGLVADQADGDDGTASGTGETVESTTAAGLRFLESLKNAKDKNGRPIATHFLTLPDKDSIPEYYEVIKLPIAIDTIEGKLRRGEYSTLAQVESDQKRLVNNAKSYNDKKSIIYEDAERLRKTASNWMVKHNPAYRIHGYQAVPTPIPGEEPVPFGKPTPRVQPSTPRQVAQQTPDKSSTDRPRRAAAAVASQSMTPAPSKLRQSASAVPDGADDRPGFKGKTFQQAQHQIIRELMDFTDPENGLLIFSPFVNLPNRSLRDYYQQIKEPVSLSKVLKRVRGVVGRNAPTDITELKSWDAFENMTSMIWKNARTYNEDGSDLYNVSIELEEMFKKRLEEAKASIAEPPQPKLKLNMSTATPSTPTPAAAPKQQLKIKLRQSPVSDPTTARARSSATPGFIVDNEALLRQQRHVMESMNGTRSSRPSSAGKSGTPVATNPFTGAKGAATAGSPLPATQPKTAASPPATNGIKRDVQSPALSAIRPGSNAPDNQGQRLNASAHTPHAVLAPPQATDRPASGSPLPNTPYGQQASHPNQYQPPTYHVPPVVPHFENFRKKPLKSLDEALIPKITLATHPALGLSKPWSTEIPTNKLKTSYSVTMMLPQKYSYLQVIPKVPLALTGRPYRLFVTVNGSKSLEVNRLSVTAGINGSLPNGFEGGKKKGEPAYDAKLMQGVNRLEIEIVAEKDRKGKPESKDPKEQLDIEKCTVFIQLM
ncbi:Bromodomain-domain-containing protein [Periconia macrospinosa]|uniref:Bromodomain-domain-containing protein n=1 Tax=Periconia macrospinosa TaxID=97972 RepID=A0A2V1ED53_9PLEO|nr:Bromodomain-domain-containing protein [Periconia macrospinosa]